MDLHLTTTTTQFNPDAKHETPPHIQPIKSLSFTNGALKNHHHHHLTAAPSAAVGTYKECLKNHAASLGGHALDGCGEFMASPTTATDPTSLKCAACGCHRNFHRRDPDEPTTAFILDFRHHPPPPPLRTSLSPSTSPPLLPPPPSYYSSAPQMLLALSTAVAEDHPKTNHSQFPSPATAKTENPVGRKRFRSKFSQDQKEKMFTFSEKLGWKMQKCDDGLVEKFCNEIGVRKGVLKVWMHNNKLNFLKRSSSDNMNNNNNNSTDHDLNHHMEEDITGVHLHVSSTNGSTSSSSRSVERESDEGLENNG